MKKNVLLAVSFLSLGMLLGRWATGDTSPDDSGGVSPGFPQKEVATRTAKTEETSPRSGSSNNSSDDPGWAGDDWISLPRGVFEKVALAAGIPTPEGDLFGPQDPCIEALALDDHEVAFLQQEWRGVCKKLKQAEVECLSFSENRDGSVVMTLDPTSGARAEQRKAFRLAAIERLGEQRGEAFVALKGGDDLLGSGDQPVEYHVDMEENGSGGWRFRVEQSSGDQRQMWVCDAIPEKLQHLTDAAGIRRRLHDPTLDPGQE
ncbi:MAG: hypothetical protein AAGI48_04895 [Verrucomicrobiota bacterium]